jgi:RNA polymerase sigma-70 factor, ECF subfamily
MAGDPGQPLVTDGATIDHVVDEIATAARARWPELSLERARFRAHLVARAGASDPRSLAGADLWLACALLHEPESALPVFEREHGPHVRALLGRVSTLGATEDDVVQLLREKLFTGGNPKIGEYSGRGPLRRWLAMIVRRMVIDVARRRDGQREVARSPDDLLDLPGVDEDPELAHIKQHYREVFRRAFTSAFEALSARQRNLLRQRVVHGIGSAALATAYGVDRATIKRWLSAAHAELLGKLRGALGEAGVRPEEVVSVMRLIRSNLNLSLERLLDR